ncbi:hypothetical protein B0H65DRAFT_58422 [Neurospora tetraspora]|uniref:Uncharacterized protein n=1 Tax=Neurospora tetraspora TaxID=94610 RepID=A0AAE0JQV6_9PEZI|nr:hypothetical protein B0H65DRAFT_58422 [Neurospora tetraspora]
MIFLPLVCTTIPTRLSSSTISHPPCITERCLSSSFLPLVYLASLFFTFNFSFWVWGEASSRGFPSMMAFWMVQNGVKREGKGTVNRLVTTTDSRFKEEAGYPSGFIAVMVWDIVTLEYHELGDSTKYRIYILLWFRAKEKPPCQVPGTDHHGQNFGVV